MLLELGEGVKGDDKGLQQMVRPEETVDRWTISPPLVV
jgi:hypothetical protein